MKENKRAIARLKKNRENELQFIMEQLFILEAQMRKEQKEVFSQLALRDITIKGQKEEIERLRRDNRRLINRLKKYENEDKHSLPSSPREKGVEIPQSKATICDSSSLERHAVDTSDVSYVRAITPKVLHKPPIAEKPKGLNARKEKKSECNIVSTISQLLEEESDTVTCGSGCSEPSSPEATLKPVTPRVIRLARKFENMTTNCTTASDSSPECTRHNSNMAFVLDECEVTSGYNSDSVSDHDYENIRLKSLEKFINEADDGYVVLKSVVDCENKENIDMQDDHVYSNVSFSINENLKKEDAICDERVLETDLESLSPELDSSATHNLSSFNVPRSRHNINHIIDIQGNHMNENFEEFTLDSLELEEDKEVVPSSEVRRSGDGAEAVNEHVQNQLLESSLDSSVHSVTLLTSCQYEKFLEVTGLSQKSILTPTRMFSNHRSVMKPRDIKHRDKLRANSVPGKDDYISVNSSTVSRYWTQPFL